MKKIPEEEKYDKKWFLIVENEQLGPFSLADLKKEPGFNPDTLVWKKGFKEWTKARFVLELQELFKDEPDPHPTHETKNNIDLKGLQESQDILTMQQDPYPIILWILLLLLIMFYTFYRFTLNHS